MLVLIIKLLFAHVVGDFLLQPSSWVKSKEEKKHKSPFLYWHILIHAVVLLIVLQFDTTYWLGFLIIVITHYFTDLIKLNLIGKFNYRKLFFLDQVDHILVIIGVGYLYNYETVNFENLEFIKIILFLTFALIATVVSSVFVDIIISKWKLEEDGDNSLENAGKFIGILERLFIFVFILMGFVSGIGFLLAAKSVFRFGDLSKAKDRKLTEYILIGTLLSFGMAILAGVGYQYFVTII